MTANPHIPFRPDLPVPEARPLRILFGSAHPYLPQMFGGAQSSTHELAERFRLRGHKVAVLAGLTGEGWVGLRGRLVQKFGRRGFVRDTALGYPVYRAWFAVRAVAEVARDFGADVAVFQSRLPVALARAVDRRAIRTFIYLRNVETVDLGGNPGALADTGFIANSRFTAGRFAAHDAIDATVVYPMIDPERYRVESTRRNVTFINPHPDKGVDIALDIAARCPDIPFVFVRSWGLSDSDEADLQRRLAFLPNVTLRASTSDMKSVYRDAAIVLAPSRWEEAFGRIAAEAQVSGIPVVGSNRGGLPEAIGPGGIVVAADAPVADWVGAVRGLWDDRDRYDAVSAAARAHAARPEMNADAQIDSLLRLFRTDPAARGP
jgi:glycosyltransferase involved in cell wall biosynthesis